MFNQTGQQGDSVNVVHDPLQDIQRQQETLNIAIQQHEEEPDIVTSLKQQKDILGEMAKDYKAEQEFLSQHTDAGGAYRSSLHHSGNLGDLLMSGDHSVRTFTHTINKFADENPSKVAAEDTNKKTESSPPL